MGKSRTRKQRWRTSTKVDSHTILEQAALTEKSDEELFTLDTTGTIQKASKKTLAHWQALRAGTSQDTVAMVTRIALTGESENEPHWRAELRRAAEEEARGVELMRKRAEAQVAAKPRIGREERQRQQRRLQRYRKSRKVLADKSSTLGQVLNREEVRPPRLTQQRGSRTSFKAKEDAALAEVEDMGAMADEELQSMDIWGSTGEAPAEPQKLVVSGQGRLQFELENPLRQRVHRVHDAPAKSRSGRLVVPSAGASYNPTEEDHSEALAAAGRVELERGQEEQRLKQRLQELEQAKLAARLRAFTADSDDDYSSDEDVDDPMTAPRLDGLRKTRQERNKEKRHREHLREVERRRAEKALRHAQHDIHGAKRRAREEAKQQEAEREQLRQLREERDKTAVKKLGRHDYEPSRPAVQLPEEQTFNARTISTDGSLLVDTLNSWQRRMLIAPRVRDTSSHKKKHKTLAYSRKGWKGVDISVLDPNAGLKRKVARRKEAARKQEK
ncbi:MAG: hypothetical protein MHM6MM_000495 [Cercozoa sp. M6MM]